MLSVDFLIKLISELFEYFGQMLGSIKALLEQFLVSEHCSIFLDLTEVLSMLGLAQLDEAE